MIEDIKEAVTVSLNLYNQVDSYRLETDSKVKHLALGQCLRSIIEILEDDRGSNQSTAT